MRISDWSSDVCSSDLEPAVAAALAVPLEVRMRQGALKNLLAGTTCVAHHDPWHAVCDEPGFPVAVLREYGWAYAPGWPGYGPDVRRSFKSEGHTSELQSLMRISYAVFCLKKKTRTLK